MAKRHMQAIEQHDSVEGTDFDGEVSTQARPPRAKPDGVGELVSHGGVTHLGRTVKYGSPAGSPLQGDPGPGLVRGAAGGDLEGTRNWAGSTSAPPTLSNTLRAARSGKSGSVSYPG